MNTTQRLKLLSQSKAVAFGQFLGVYSRNSVGPRGVAFHDTLMGKDYIVSYVGGGVWAISVDRFLYQTVGRFDLSDDRIRPINWNPDQTFRELDPVFVDRLLTMDSNLLKLLALVGSLWANETDVVEVTSDYSYPIQVKPIGTWSDLIEPPHSIDPYFLVTHRVRIR